MQLLLSELQDNVGIAWYIQYQIFFSSSFIHQAPSSFFLHPYRSDYECVVCREFVNHLVAIAIVLAIISPVPIQSRINKKLASLTIHHVKNRTQIRRLSTPDRD